MYGQLLKHRRLTLSWSVSISMMRERVCVCMEVVLMADKFSRIEISTFGNVMEAKVQLFI